MDQSIKSFYLLTAVVAHPPQTISHSLLSAWLPPAFLSFPSLTLLTTSDLASQPRPFVICAGPLDQRLGAGKGAEITDMVSAANIPEDPGGCSVVSR